MSRPDDPEGWLVILVVAVLAAALLIGVKHVFAQERADECYWLWDMALVARALAEEEIPQPKIVGAMGRIYNGPVEARVMMAQMAIASSLPAPVFAGVIRTRCNALTPRTSPAPALL